MSEENADDEGDGAQWTYLPSIDAGFAWAEYDRAIVDAGVKVRAADEATALVAATLSAALAIGPRPVKVPS